MNRLRQYPDLNRLARIPLFLSMLLATTETHELEPMNRSDLIEGYLKTLIAPAEHKIVTDGLPAPSLRTIAQDIAYRKIEAQEIGVSETEVRAVIAQHTPDAEAADRIFHSFGATASSRRRARSGSDSRTRSFRSTWPPAIS